MMNLCVHLRKDVNVYTHTTKSIHTQNYALAYHLQYPGRASSTQISSLRRNTFSLSVTQNSPPRWPGFSLMCPHTYIHVALEQGNITEL